MVERGLCKPEVVGSIPIVSTEREWGKWAQCRTVGRHRSRVLTARACDEVPAPVAATVPVPKLERRYCEWPWSFIHWA